MTLEIFNIIEENWKELQNYKQKHIILFSSPRDVLENKILAKN